MNDKPETKIGYVSPLKRICMTIGELPTSYLETMTYYEMLIWFVEFLKNQVIPVVNNNSEATEELQHLFIELQSYVNNYFTNELPEYISNEIDKLVEDGTLENLLNDALHLIRRYDTTNEMISNKSSLTNGMIIFTFGKNTINDGDGGKYYINNVNGEIDLENGLFAKLLNNIESNFYNLNYYNEEHYDSNCYFVEIPLNDENNNEINIFTAYHPTESPNEYAINNKTSVTINSSLSYTTNTTGYPNIIGNGELLVNDNVGSLPNNNVYLGIKANREIELYGANSTAQAMLADGVLNNACIWGQTAINGIYNELEVGETYSPRTMLGVKADKTFIFMVTDGRTVIDKGITFEQATNILLDKECLDVYALDGGGSTSLSINGMKVNKNIDGHGLIERRNAVTFNVKKQTTNEEIAKNTINSGKIKNNLTNEIMPIINEIGTTISDYNLNSLNNKLYLSYGANMLNCPENGYGYVINIPHIGANTGTEYSTQLFIHYETSNIYKRQKIGSEFTPWESVHGNKLYAIYDGDNNIVLSADNTYQNCYFRKFQSTINNLIEVDTTSSVVETTYYDKLKIKKDGTYKITAQLFMRADVAGNKNIQISKNNASSNFNVGTTYIGLNEYGCVETFLVNSFAKNDYVYIKARGNIGDSVVRARVIIEEF